MPRRRMPPPASSGRSVPRPAPPLPRAHAPLPRAPIRFAFRLSAPDPCCSAACSIEELKLDFSDRDISNAAKLPEMLAQVLPVLDPCVHTSAQVARARRSPAHCALSRVCAPACSPLLSLQVADSFNQLITLMSGISNFDDQFRRLEITANGTRYDLDALTDRCTRVMPACVSAFLLSACTGRAHLGSHNPRRTIDAFRAAGMCLHSGLAGGRGRQC